MSRSGMDRNWLRGALCVMLGAAAFWISVEYLGPNADDSVVQAVAPRPERPGLLPPPVAGAPSPSADAGPQSRLAAEVRQNPFGSLNLRPPAVASVGLPQATRQSVKQAKKAAAPPEPPPPPPMAPPLPFVAIGSIEGIDVTSGQPVAFLQQQDALLIVRKGESIGQLYRVESVSSDKVEFTYLPLNQRQTLSFAR